MTNLVFRDGDPFYFNACVGDNGFVDYLTYADGYSKASNVLLDQVLSNNGKDVDTFIYPICFNMRHSIELRLKGAIQKLENLASIRGVRILAFNYDKSHDITNIWDYFDENSKNIDIRFRQLNDLMGNYILDIGEVDSTGQVFRYPVDENGAKHLLKIGNINCLFLKVVFSKLEGNLNDLDNLINQLIEEYELKTFTRELSREQIFSLARELPEYKDWKLRLSKNYKKKLRDEFRISSNELTKAVNIIKTNYELAGLIGLHKPLLACNEDQLLKLCREWVEKIKPDYKEFYNGKIKIIDFDNRNSLSEQFARIKSIDTVCRNIITTLNINHIADLWALFYLSRDNMKYSEQYEIIFENFYSDIKMCGSILESFKHVFTKSSFLENIVKSLYFLYKVDLAEKIVNEHELALCFDFIDSARNRSLFNKCQYLGYTFKIS